MGTFVERFLAMFLGRRERVLAIVAALLLLPTYLFPLWQLTMFAPQYPDGLRLQIYSYRLAGGNKGQDVDEINVLNHYIGMRSLAQEDFTEFKWMPFVIGIVALVFLRASVFGRAGALVDATVLYGYFALFALWSFAYKLYRYGHELAPGAAVNVPAFTPPIFGYKQLANFEVYSYPALGSYALAACGLVAAAAVVLSFLRARREQAA